MLRYIARLDRILNKPIASIACKRFYWSKYTGKNSALHPAFYVSWKNDAKRNAKIALEKSADDPELAMIVREALNDQKQEMKTFCASDNFREAFKIYKNLAEAGVLRQKEIILFLQMLHRLFCTLQGIVCISSTESFADRQELSQKLSDTLDFVIESIKKDEEMANGRVWSFILRISLTSNNLKLFKATWDYVRELPIEASAKYNRSRVDASCYACAIEYKAQIGLPLDSCRELLKEAVSRKLNPTPDLYRSMILALFWHSQDQEAFELLDLAIEMLGAKISSDWLSVLLVRLAAWEKSEYAQKCFKRIAKKSLIPNSLSMNRLITEMKLSGASLDSIADVFFQYIELGGLVEPRLLNSVLDSIFQDALYIALEKQIAVAAFKETAKQDVAESDNTQSLPRINLRQDSTNVQFLGTVQVGSINLKNKNFLKAALLKTNDKSLCDNTAMLVDKFLTTMIKKGYEISVDTFNVLISGYFALGDHERVNKTLQDLDKSGFHPTALTFRVILKTFMYSNVSVKMIDNIWKRLMQINLTCPYEPNIHDIDWLMLIKLQKTMPLRTQELKRFIVDKLIEYAPQYYEINQKVLPNDLKNLFQRQNLDNLTNIADSILAVPADERENSSFESLLIKVGALHLLESDVARIERDKEKQIDQEILIEKILERKKLEKEKRHVKTVSDDQRVNEMIAKWSDVK